MKLTICSFQKMIRKLKTTSDWKKILENHISNERVLSKYIENSQTDTK